MKLLHVSDWHLGRSTYGCSRASDHEEVLQEIVQLAREEKPDLVVHAGDLFDGVRPAYADMQLGLWALQELAALAPVVVVAGNHDSRALFRIFHQLQAQGSRLHFVDRPRLPRDGGVLDFPVSGGRRARLAVLPFVHANRVVEAFEDPKTWSARYADRVGAIQETLLEGLLDGYDPARDVLLSAAHLHVAGARFSGSERQIHVSAHYASRLEHVPQVSYAAFGHIHRPQALPGTTPGRYAGSPLQLDFGEVDEAKEVVIVQAEPGEPARIEPRPLTSGRRLRRFEGTLEQLAEQAAEFGNQLCLVTIHTQQPEADLSGRVRQLIPEATVLQVREVCREHQLEVVTPRAGGAREPGLEELFEDYLAEHGTRTGSAARVSEIFAVLLASVRDEEPPGFEEVESFGLPAEEAEPELELAMESA